MQIVDARLVRCTFVKRDFLAFCLVLVFAAGRADAQWTQFRGPNGAGVGAAAEYPVEFSPANNMAWKASVPYGQSSPVVVGTRLYGTASEGDRLITFCLDTRTGREVWRREARRERVMDIYKANDSANSTRPRFAGAFRRIFRTSPRRFSIRASFTWSRPAASSPRSTLRPAAS